MSAFFLLTGLAFVGVAMLTVFAVVALLVRMAIRLVLLPLLFIKWMVLALMMVVVGPILFVVGAIVAVALALAVAAPLLPLFAVAALVWLIVRANRPAVA